MAKNDKKSGRSSRRGQKTIDDNGDDKGDEWKVIGWLNPTKKGKVITLTTPKTEDGEGGDLMGFIRVDSLERMLDDDIGGTPVKMPPKDDDD